jgi:hypothetical protein
VLLPSATLVAAVLAALAASWAAHLQRKSGRELDTRSRFEEVMRNLRWAAELALSTDPARARLGTGELHALGESGLLDADGQVFVDAALAAVIEEPMQLVASAAPDAEVLEIPTGVGGDDVASEVDDPTSGDEGEGQP